MKMEKEVRFRAAYDHRDKNYSVHGMDVSLVLKGQRGAVEAVIWTNWYLDGSHHEPKVGVVIFHSPLPEFDNDPWPFRDEVADDCTILNGPCYRSAGLGSEEEREVLDALISGGDDAVWAKLQEFYDDKFGPDTPEREVLYRNFREVM